MVNNLTSKCPQCMKIIRMLVIDGMMQNRRIFVRFVRSEANILTDALSHFQFQRFWCHAPPDMNTMPDKLPEAIYPVERLWLSNTEH